MGPRRLIYVPLCRIPDEGAMKQMKPNGIISDDVG